eukprot:11475458-Alexandrium_andersonii.AAC.1
MRARARSACARAHTVYRIRKSTHWSVLASTLLEAHAFTSDLRKTAQSNPSDTDHPGSLMQEGAMQTATPVAS